MNFIFNNLIYDSYIIIFNQLIEIHNIIIGYKYMPLNRLCLS